MIEAATTANPGSAARTFAPGENALCFLLTHAGAGLVDGILLGPSPVEPPWIVWLDPDRRETWHQKFPTCRCRYGHRVSDMSRDELFQGSFRPGDTAAKDNLVICGCYGRFVE